MTTIRRQLKNVVKNYTEAEVKVREATSNDPWGPSSTLMSEISDLTYNIVALGDIMRMIWKRLNDHGKNWRHVYKSLVLLDYLIKNGNEKVAQQCKEHIVAIQTLKDFQYLEENKDQGANVRDKAKQLVSLLRDDDRLKQERAKALKARERYAQTAMGISSDNKVTYQTSRYTGASTKTGGNYSDPYGGGGGGGVGAGGATPTNPLSPELEAVRPSDQNEEELQVNLALMLSQQEHEEEVKRKRADEAKLALAIEQSKMETSASPHDDGLLDLASGYSGAGASNTDPWNDNHLIHNNNNSNKYNSFQSKPDPWSLNSIPTTTTTTTTSTNIFNNNISTSNNIHKQLEDPWATPISSTNNHNNNNVWGGNSNDFSNLKTTNNDPWGASSEPPMNNQQDEFDVFTSKRVTSPVNTFQSTTHTTMNTNNDPFGDFFGGGSNTTEKKSTNPWNQPINTNQQQQQQQQQQQHIQNPIRKTPESFLGENSSLVNLDNLIPINNTSSSIMQNNQQQQRPKSTNPFNGGPAFSTTPTYSLQTSLSNTNISTNTNAAKGPVSNPFMQTQKGPTINQLAQQQHQQQFGISPSSPITIPSVNSTMMPPLLPTSNAIGGGGGGGGGGVGQPLYPSLVPLQQNYAAAPNPTSTNAFNSQQQSTNPFLMM